MKIIDLLNKIANGEEVPKRIKVYSKWHDKEVIYFLTDTNFSWQDWYMNEEDNTDYSLFENNSVSLNDEVEIIEEEKKIEKFIQVDTEEPEEIIEEVKIKENKYRFRFSQSEWLITEKINEIIDYLNSKGDE